MPGSLAKIEVKPLEEGLEASLLGRRKSRHHHHNHHHHSASPITTDEMLSSDESTILDGATTSVYLDNDEGEEDEWTTSGTNPRGEIQDLDAKLVDPNIGNVLNSFINAQESEIHPHDLPNSHEEVSEEYDEEEEVIELEFERAIKKLDTHTMHCPKCNTQVTKVILRRKRKIIRKYRKPLSLLGCLPCLSVFIPSGNSFNMFGIFGNTSPANISRDHANVVIQEKGDCFGLFRIFLNKFTSERKGNPLKTSAVDVEHDFPSDTSVVNENKVIEQVHANGEQGREIEGKDVAKRRNSAYYAYAWLHQHGKRFGGQNAPQGVIQPDNVTLDVRDDSYENALKANFLSKNNGEIEEKQNTADGLLEEGYYRSRDEEGGFLDKQITSPPRENMSDTSNDEDYKLIEIVKSIVYGGLMQSITSLSIVVSAAASDVTTLSIIALGMANVFGGLFIISPSLWYLKNDISNEQVNKYQELLGRRENFSLHATFAILSFLLFGFIPPVTYGFSFRISNDKLMKILAVVATGLLSVVLLAFGKAYVQNYQNTHKLCAYVKILMYYVMMAIMVSGISFLAGHLIKEFAEELALFDSSLPANLMSSVLSSF